MNFEKPGKDNTDKTLELAYSRARMRETTAYFDREKARSQIARAIGHWSGSRATATKEG